MSLFEQSTVLHRVITSLQSTNISRNSPVKESDIKRGSPGTGCSGANGLSGLCMSGGSGGAVEKVPAEKQSGKKSGDSDVESKG